MTKGGRELQLDKRDKFFNDPVFQVSRKRNLTKTPRVAATVCPPTPGRVLIKSEEISLWEVSPKMGMSVS